MENISIPESLKVKEISEFHNNFLLEPLRTGYGETMGNFMKDLLVNELTGFSPVSIEFKSMDKKTRKVDGVQEDILDITLNIKNIICRLNDQEEYVKTLKLSGKKEVTAADLADDTLEIVNGDLYLFTVKDKEKFEIDITFKKGNGYVLSYEHKKEKNVPFNKFYLDSFFSPVVLIDMDVSPIRIGGNMDFERLTMELKTNGIISPKEALKSISLMVQERLSILAEKRERPVYVEEEEIDEDVEMEPETDEEETVAATPDKSVPVEEILILECELSQRARNCLKNFPYRKLVDFTKVSADELMRLKNFGQKTLDELREILAEHGLTLKGETLD